MGLPNEPPTAEEEAAYLYFSKPDLSIDSVSNGLLKIARMSDLPVDRITPEYVASVKQRQEWCAKDLRELVDELRSVCNAIDNTLDQLFPVTPRQVQPVGEAPF